MKNKLTYLAAMVVLVSVTIIEAQIIPTQTSTFFRGTVTFNGAPAPVGTVVDAFDPDGVRCGSFTVGDLVDSAGIYGFMPVYGDDSYSPSIDEGAENGDMISFEVNGRNATVVSGDVSWEDKTLKEVNLSASGTVGFMLLDFDDIFEGAPLDTVRFDLQVKNLGDGTDFYGVTSTSIHGWTTIDATAPAYADPGDTAALYFEVAIPDWGPDNVDTISFSVFSHLDTTVVMDNAFVIRSNVPDSLLHFFINKYPADTTASPNNTVRFEIGITNDGGINTDKGAVYDDYYGVSSTSGAGWTTVNSELTLVPGDSSGIVFFDVIIPQSITTLVDTIDYTVFSHLNPALSYDSSVIITIPVDSATVSLTIVEPAAYQAGTPGDTALFTVGVLNDGNIADTYAISLDSMTDGSWPFIAGSAVSNLPGDTAYISFSVVIPVNTSTLLNAIAYTVTSTVDPSVSDGAIVNLSRISTDVHERQLAGLPDKFAVSQNYPNPFNPVTSIEYALPGKSDVSLEVYNLLGRQVERLDFGSRPAGNFHLEYDGSRLASGVYFYRIVTDFGAETKKMVLLK